MRSIKVWALVLFTFFLGLPLPAEETPTVNRLAIVTADALRVRSAPSLNSIIQGILHAKDQVLLTRRAEALETIAERTGYWYEVVTPLQYRGWVFGGYLNIASEQVSVQDYLFKGKAENQEIGNNFARLPEMEADFTEINNLARRGKHRESLQKIQQLPHHPLLDYIYNERYGIMLDPCMWARTESKDIYNAFVDCIKQKVSIKDLLPPTIDWGLFHSEWIGFTSNDDLEKEINAKSMFTISSLEMGEDCAAFYLTDTQPVGSSDEQPSNQSIHTWPPGGILIIQIIKMKNTIFPKLNGKYEITTVIRADSNTFERMIQEYGKEDYVFSFVPPTKRMMYGLDNLVSYQ